jgi:hypothetical protein
LLSWAYYPARDVPSMPPARATPVDLDEDYPEVNLRRAEFFRKGAGCAAR